MTEDSPVALMGDLDRSELWRYDIFNVSRLRNASTYFGIPSTDFYNTFYNDNVDRFNTDIGLLSASFNHLYGDLNNRTILQAFLGIKYTLAPLSKGFYLSPGHLSDPVMTNRIDDTYYGVFENTYGLPLAFSYGAECISQSDWTSLSLVERQECLLQTLVLDDVNNESNCRGKLVFNSKQSEWSVVRKDEGVTVTPSSISVDEADSTLTILMPTYDDTELYLEINGLQYNDFVIEKIRNANSSLAGWHDGSLAVEDFLSSPRRNSGIRFKTNDGMSTGLYLTNYLDEGYSDKHHWLVNLGVSHQGKRTVQLTFNQPGVYSFESIRAVSQPLSDVASFVDARNAAGCSVSRNGVNGYSITAESNRNRRYNRR